MPVSLNKTFSSLCPLFLSYMNKVTPCIFNYYNIDRYYIFQLNRLLPLSTFCLRQSWFPRDSAFS